MPYIVTTTKGPGPAGGRHLPKHEQSRRAVATLDEAQREAASLAESAGLDPYLEVWALPEQGGTISLPDGTVIEVEPCDWTFLARDGSRYFHGTDEEIIVAYNAAQENR